MNTHALLQELGFGDYEARAYLSLVEAGASCNGYEVAKTAGMPRANVYPVLEKLVERGAAQRLDTPQGVRYAATPPERLIGRLDKKHRRTLAAAQDALAALAQTSEPEPVFNLRSHEELTTQARADIDSARETLLVAIQPPEATALAQSLREARERGVAINTLCMEGCTAECGGCQGDIHRYHFAPAKDARWLLLVTDERRMLAGEILPAQTLAVATGQRLIVELVASWIRQSVVLATVADDLGERFRGLLSEEARRILDALHPEDGFSGRREQAAGVKTG
ncbi:MAG: TrmB family transcriptional regulator [Gammaproteobacteria bacterium]